MFSRKVSYVLSPQSWFCKLSLSFYFIIFFPDVNGSLESVQVDLFEKEICGGLKLSIFQYNIVHFQSSTLGGIFSLA